MPDLSQVVGALLRDVAKARFGSDLYARDVARYYEQDGLLRRFPVPRPEVTEVEIDLKFQIGSIAPEPTQHELTEATLATIHEPFAHRVTLAILDALGAELERKTREPQLRVAPSVEHKAGRTWVVIDVRKAVLKALLDAWGRAGDARTAEDAVRLAAKVRSAVAAQLARDLEPTDAERAADERAQPPPPAGPAARTVRDLTGATLDRARPQVEDLLKGLADELARASGGRGDCRVDVEVGHDRLSQAAEGALSSIRLKATVRNYVWTQVATEKGEQHWYALNPE